ncbi:hypothetical protein [uncultured Thiodictyon sp.]|uniref:hypothetical protein n=1 Tax=uncultured Thiodictyon sp. TaxID=1846217 RepID=UPI0025DF332F|nr:hypothetical protein [uncultured Thiodictyon sp.]
MSVRPPPVDSGHRGARRVRNGCGRDRRDDVAHHEDIRGCREPVGGTVEDAHVLEQDRGGLHTLRLRERSGGVQQAAERGG